MEKSTRNFWGIAIALGMLFVGEREISNWGYYTKIDPDLKEESDIYRGLRIEQNQIDEQGRQIRRRMEAEMAENDARETREKLEREKKERAIQQKTKELEKKVYEEEVTPELVDWMVNAESTNNPRVISSKGARGLLQIMPGTWSNQTERIYGEPLDFNMADDPVTNRLVGASYAVVVRNHLSSNLPVWQRSNYDQRQNLIAAGYNGGMYLLVKEGSIPSMPQETITYVDKIEKERAKSRKSG